MKKSKVVGSVFMGEEKEKYIENYILDLGKQLQASGFPITTDQLNRVINRYASSSASREEIIEQLDSMVKEYMENYKKLQKQKELLSQKENIKDLRDLPVQYQGITLNTQDIDLMLIAGADSLEELQEALLQITNINVDDISIEGEFEQIRQTVFNRYLDSLISQNDAIQNPAILLQKRINYLEENSDISPEVVESLKTIIKESKTQKEILQRARETFSSEELHHIFWTMNETMPMEKTGIKQATVESTRNLLKLINSSYTSITLDEVGKYSSVVLGDGTYDFRRLKKGLDFAKKLGKSVRLNTLIFYQDCPQGLYELEKTPGNRARVKAALGSYIDAVTKFIRENDYEDTVRSIDVLNELLNRFPLSVENPYQYRGTISQKEAPDFDNIQSGWLKHLEIEDLCDVLVRARRNLPKTDFMYNDDNLIDENKLPPTLAILQRIKSWEKRNQVQIIDSIGTQMHVDNDITKEQIKNMLQTLNTLNLPIEITEFDLTMNRGVEGLSDLQIEVARQQKLNEIIQGIMDAEINLRGVTIWSKTDTQSFRVYLENQKRKKEGKTPIKTLHSGYLTENMELKSQALWHEFNRQNFNYHTHTNRCGHAGIATDKEYVEYARQAGLKQLGFSDHIPFSDLEYTDETSRMHIEDAEEYLSSIHTLQQENPDMTILCGFEAEFDPRKIEFLGKLRKKADYFILGQHFVQEESGKIKRSNNPNYPLDYAKSVCTALDTGLYDIVAHPDIFMEYRDSIKTEDGRRLFDENAKQASYLICKKAQELQIPLEINLGGIDKQEVLSNGELAYPNKTFWQVAKETQVPVLYGVDAHSPDSFLRMRENINKANKVIDIDHLNMVDKDYNPKRQRKQNKELDERLEQSIEESPTLETYLVDRVVSRALIKPNDNTPIEDEIVHALEGGINKLQEEGQKKIRCSARRVEELSQNKTLSSAEKTFFLSRMKNALHHTQDTLRRRKRVLETAITATKTATTLGCTTKEEYQRSISLLTEKNTQADRKKQEQVSTQLGQMLDENDKQPTKAPQSTLTKTFAKKIKSSTGITTFNVLIIITGFLLLSIAFLINVLK